MTPQPILSLCACLEPQCTIPYGLCHCGCGKKTLVPRKNDASKKHMAGIPILYFTRHSPKYRNRNKDKKSRNPFHYVDGRPKYEINEITGCWEWFAAKASKTGYGTAILNGKNENAHRVMWIFHHGKPSEGMQVDHLCRNRACIKIEHLELVSAGENVRRGAAAKFNRKQIEIIRKMYYDEGISQSEIAKRYRVNSATISRLCRRESWGMDNRVYFPLQFAYLCLSCDSVSNSSTQCPHCGTSTLMSLSGVLNRTIQPVKEEINAS